MSRVSDKDVAMETLRQMPAASILEQIREELAIPAAVHKGKAAADAGQVTLHGEVRQKLASWISESFGQTRPWQTCGQSLLLSLVLPGFR